MATRDAGRGTYPGTQANILSTVDHCIFYVFLQYIAQRVEYERAAGLNPQAAGPPEEAYSTTQISTSREVHSNLLDCFSSQRSSGLVQRGFVGSKFLEFFCKILASQILLQSLFEMLLVRY